MRAGWLPVVLVAFVALGPVAAAAAPARDLDYVVVEPPHTGLWSGGPAVIYLNPCVGRCTVRAGADSAVADTSSILGRNGLPSEITLEPFKYDQATWDGMVACVRATYAIYDVTVVTDRPTGPHVEVMVAGTPDALGLASNTLGISPLANDCSRIPSAVSFAFANAHSAGATLIPELCATVAHEAGHTFGLDHEFDCRDPMTYLGSCGPKLFLNRTVECGEFAGPRPCRCAAKQSSHDHLYDVIGPGALPMAPTLTMQSPLAAAQVPSTFSVFVTAAGRSMITVELWINGAKVTEAVGKVSSSPYELRTPASLVDGVLDLEVRAYDDSGQVGTVRRTVQKGAACADAGACPAGWTCDGGRCLAPAGAGAVGEACSADSDCALGECGATGGAAACTQPCWPTGAACPDGLSCVAGTDEGYACYRDDGSGGGCCSAGGDPRGSAAGALLVLLALGARGRRVRGSRRRSSG